jgi:preprotein translocase subunit SecB
MADQTNGSSGASGDAAATAAPQQVQVQLVSQYIKDLSFENPNVSRMVEEKAESPEMRFEISVNGKRTGQDLYESSIQFRGTASSNVGTIYELEVDYAGLFRIQNIPKEALEPFLLVNCPTLIFPFLRRIVSDVTRDGGFPPLLLDPMDFGALFMRRKQQEKSEGKLPS